MDVHKSKVFVSMLVAGAESPLEHSLPNEPRAIRKLIRRLKRGPGDVVACYEAGPCGYVLQREFEEAGLTCFVIAPTLIPEKKGDRIKTDRRDARKLADYLRSGILTAIEPPSPEQESARDLVRCRADHRISLKAARNRLNHFLLRRGVRYTTGKKAWTKAYVRWLHQLSFDDAVAQVVFDQYMLAIEQTAERLAIVDTQIEELAQTDRYREVVGALRCFRGIDTLTAMTLVTELYEFARFGSARDLMGFLGLVPSERTSIRRQLGGITKMGNREVRRVLVEASLHSRHRPAVGAGLRKRRAGQPAHAIARADHAQQRLHARYKRLTARGKHSNIVTVAIARELAGFVWAAMRETSMSK